MMLARVSAALFFVLLVSSGCRSECAKLCDRQTHCSGVYDNPADQSLHPDKQRELCVTFCEAMHEDPARAQELEAVTACSQKSDCDAFRTCVRAAAPSKTPSKTPSKAP